MDEDERDVTDEAYCECGALLASDGACENENHDDAAY